MRSALDATTQVNFDQVEPKQVLDFLRQRVPGINIIEQYQLSAVARVSLTLKEPVPVGAVFQWAEDQYGLRFVVRDYGVVVTNKERVPPGAVNL